VLASKPDTTNALVTIPPPANACSGKGAGDTGTVSIVIFGVKLPDVCPLFVHVTLTSTIQVPSTQGLDLGVTVILVAVMFATVYNVTIGTVVVDPPVILKDPVALMYPAFVNVYE